MTTKTCRHCGQQSAGPTGLCADCFLDGDASKGSLTRPADEPVVWEVLCQSENTGKWIKVTETHDPLAHQSISSINNLRFRTASSPHLWQVRDGEIVSAEAKGGIYIPFDAPKTQPKGQVKTCATTPQATSESAEIPTTSTNQPLVASNGSGEVPSLAAANDWSEDFSHENGRYLNTCHVCGSSFMGHKRRVTCKLCVVPSNPPQGQAHWSYSPYRATLYFDGKLFAIVTPDGKNALTPETADALLQVLNRPTVAIQQPRHSEAKLTEERNALATALINARDATTGIGRQNIICDAIAGYHRRNEITPTTDVKEGS